MTTRKAVLRVAAILYRVVLTVVIVLGIIYMGQSTYRFTRAVFSDAAIESEPGRSVKIQIKEDVSTKKLAEVLETHGLVDSALVLRKIPFSSESEIPMHCLPGHESPKPLPVFLY